MESNWISVDEQLPEEKEDYDCFLDSCEVLFTDGNFVFIGPTRRWPECDGLSAQLVWYQYGSDGYSVYNVTHWMPLPELPGKAAK